MPNYANLMTGVTKQCLLLLRVACKQVQYLCMMQVTLLISLETEVFLTKPNRTIVMLT